MEEYCFAHVLEVQFSAWLVISTGSAFFLLPIPSTLGYHLFAGVTVESQFPGPRLSAALVL